MAKILITNTDRSKYLSGKTWLNQYEFQNDKDNAFCFNTVHEAQQFINEVIESWPELRRIGIDIVEYNNPDKSII